MGVWLQSLVVAALSLVVVTAGGAAAVGMQTTAATVTAAPAQEALVQEDPVPAAPATCLPQPEAAGSPHTPEQQAGHTGVSFVVPPATVIEVDRLGRVVAVSTNTGQAPCATDLFVQVAPDGTRTPADDTLRSAALERPSAGPWAPGVAQPLTAG